MCLYVLTVCWSVSAVVSSVSSAVAVAMEASSTVTPASLASPSLGTGDILLPAASPDTQTSPENSPFIKALAKFYYHSRNSGFVHHSSFKQL